MKNKYVIITFLYMVIFMNSMTLANNESIESKYKTFSPIECWSSCYMELIDNTLWEIEIEGIGISYWYMTQPKHRQVLTDVNNVAVGDLHALAVKNDGTLWVWGLNNHGQLGNGRKINEEIKEPLKIMSSVRACFARNDTSMAIKTDGSLWAWGELYTRHSSSYYSKPRKVLTNTTFAAIGYAHYMAIKEDGSLWTWGENHDGQLGNGTYKDNHKPRKVMDDVAMIAAGYFHSLALKNDGTLWAWGFNRSWELGFQSEEERVAEPVRIMDHVKSIYAYENNSMAIKEDGTLWVWGDNQYYQLGIGKVKYEMPEDYPVHEYFPFDYYMRDLPHKIMDNVKEMSAWRMQMFARKEDGSLWTWGTFAVRKKGDIQDYSRPVLVHR